MAGQVMETLEQLQQGLADLPERVAALLEDRQQPQQLPDFAFGETPGTSSGFAPSASQGATAAAGDQWFPEAAAGFEAPDFPDFSGGGGPAPSPADTASSSAVGFQPPEFAQPEFSGFAAPDWSDPGTMPFFERPEPASAGAAGGLSGDGRIESLLERIAGGVEGGGAGPLQSSHGGLGLAGPDPSVMPWAASFQAPAEGFPAASPSLNLSSTAGLRGAGGFGYGSRLDTPASDYLEPARRFPRGG